MIWLTWRQFRGQAVAAAAVIGALAIALAATGPHLWNLYSSTGLDGCRSGCGQAAGPAATWGRRHRRGCGHCLSRDSMHHGVVWPGDRWSYAACGHRAEAGCR